MHIFNEKSEIRIYNSNPITQSNIIKTVYNIPPMQLQQLRSLSKTFFTQVQKQNKHTCDQLNMLNSIPTQNDKTINSEDITYNYKNHELSLVSKLNEQIKNTEQELNTLLSQDSQLTSTNQSNNHEMQQLMNNPDLYFLDMNTFDNYCGDVEAAQEQRKSDLENTIQNLKNRINHYNKTLQLQTTRSAVFNKLLEKYNVEITGLGDNFIQQSISMLNLNIQAISKK